MKKKAKVILAPGWKKIMTLTMTLIDPLVANVKKKKKKKKKETNSTKLYLLKLIKACVCYFFFFHQMTAFRNYEKCFLFHLNSSFRA